MPRVQRAGYDHEDDLQTEVAAYLDRVLPDDAFWWHTPNSGHGVGRTPSAQVDAMKMAAKLKQMGMRPGIPDVLILWRGRLHGADAKARYGTLTDSQKVVLPRLAVAGALIEPTFRTIEEIEAALVRWGIPLKFSYAALKGQVSMKPSEAQAMQAIALASKTVKTRRIARTRRKAHAKQALSLL